MPVEVLLCLAIPRQQHNWSEVIGDLKAVSGFHGPREKLKIGNVRESQIYGIVDCNKPVKHQGSRSMTSAMHHAQENEFHTCNLGI